MPSKKQGGRMSGSPTRCARRNIAAASMGSVGGTVCDAMICVTCFGICSAYIVFMATTLATVLQPSIPAATQNALVLLNPTARHVGSGDR